MAKVRVLMIDPPSGWRYGFPKILPKEHRHRSMEWMVEQGYPQAEIDHLGKNFYCRYWEDDIEEEELKD